MSPLDRRSDEAFTGELIESAGTPPPVPAEDLAAIKEAARTVWQQHYVKSPTAVPSRRWILPVAAALMFGLMVSLWWILRPQAVTPTSIAARVDRVDGMVTTAEAPLAAGQEIAAGSVLRTGEKGRIALRLAGGQSLRVDTWSTVRLVSASLVELDAGAVYLDSPHRSQPGEVTIRTSSGAFRPIGTQFEVRLDDSGAARLRVREGRVTLERPDGSATAGEGEELIVRPDGTIVRGQLSADDVSWEWVLAAAPMPEIEGRTLRWFLEWVAREKGWKLKFERDQTAALSDRVILHGSIRDLSPDQALQTVALGSGVTYRVKNGVLIIT